jgi:stage IV sporulation protein FB
MKKILEISIWFLLAIISCLYFSNLWISLIFLFFHELAHYITGKFLGYNLKSISLLPFGMRFGFKEEFFNPWDDIIISISGPLINFLFFILFLCLNKYSSYFTLLRNINLALCLVNIFPASFLDGGRILKAIISYNSGIYKGHLISNINGIIVGGFILFLTIAKIHTSKGIILILMSIFILYKSINNIKQITMNVINDLLYKQNYTKIKRCIKIKINAFKADIKILDIIKNFCFNKYYVIYIIENGDLRYNINETELIKLYYTYGNILLGECDNYRNT